MFEVRTVIDELNTPWGCYFSTFHRPHTLFSRHYQMASTHKMTHPERSIHIIDFYCFSCLPALTWLNESINECLGCKTTLCPLCASSEGWTRNFYDADIKTGPGSVVVEEIIIEQTAYKHQQPYRSRAMKHRLSKWNVRVVIIILLHQWFRDNDGLSWEDFVLLPLFFFQLISVVM